MKMQRLLMGLTILNLILLTVILLSGSSQANSSPAVLRGSGLSFVGESDAVRAQLHADRGGTSLRLTNSAGKQRLIEP